MSGQSSVGQGSVYEAGDQRNVKNDDLKTADRYNEGVSNSHKPNDSSMSTTEGMNHSTNITPEDERSIANRLANESVRPCSNHGSLLYS